MRGDLTPLSTKVTGIVRDVRVTDFQAIHNGDPIVELEDDDYRAQVAQANAAVEAAKAAIENNRRQRELQDSRIERVLAGIDQAHAQIAAAQAGIDARRQGASYEAVEGRMSESGSISKTSSITDSGVLVRGSGSRFSQEIVAGRHHLVADEPVAAGGTDAGPTPYDLLLAALGVCTSMTVGMYARRKNWPLEGILVRLRHSKIHAEDCGECETKQGTLDRIELELELSGSLTSEQRSKLFEIAGKCPVHRTLEAGISIRSRLV